jgi:hypothetical protein
MRIIRGHFPGSGTYAFLVGIAWWEGGGLEIEQFFMREYSEELPSTANRSIGRCSKPAIA